MAEKITETNIDSLKQDDKNFNKGTKKGRKLIDKSIRKFGAGRSILLDKNNRIIAGNKTQELAKEAGIKKVIVIDAKPDELVAVRRGDVDLDSEEGREMALADNATGAANLDWDDEALSRAQEEIGLQVEDWGLSIGPKIDDTYSRKIEAPVYEPSGVSPTLSDCYDSTKTKELIEEIKKADLPDEVREFLTYAAYRHTEFNYGMIADYYCNAPKEVQGLFENSALVIIDFKKAIEKGFVRMTDELLNEYAREYEEG
nr:MAG TPA: ParB protein [Caudoviricetes sp.]